MEHLKVITKGNSNPQGKPKVFFSCHPKDFDRALSKICEDIFKTQDCAVYYTEDMSPFAPLPDNIDIILESMNLFVIPVSFNLLATDNRTMSLDYPYAVEHHIPVLPIMLEPGLDELYKRKDRFGEKQYLNPYSHDTTEISYEEKLKKYLESVLFDEKTAERVRAAFDAYIFLSYRKKDRKYANELMRIIHSNPICRDIAIWYDEFLTPGENFNDMIAKALEKSELFALLVTPNLINEDNYVKMVEYPEARKAGKRILPAEMEETDKYELGKQYEHIPDCVNAYDEAELGRSLTDSLGGIALRENRNSPEHIFLIGLAYLNGIDVEVNRERALELITGAAEAELPEAMELLADMYSEGRGVELNLNVELKWRKRIYNFRLRIYGEESPDTLAALDDLAFTYSRLGNYPKALEIQKMCYERGCEVFGEEHPITLLEMENLASAYMDLGDFQKASGLFEKSNKMLCKVLGEEHPSTLLSLNNLATAYNVLGNSEKALELLKKSYTLQCKVLGEEHPATLKSLNNLANTYGFLCNYRKALELSEKCYKLQCKVLGSEHPDTLISMNDFAMIYADSGDLKKALELQERCYDLKRKVFGEEHPMTVLARTDLAGLYSSVGDSITALKLYQNCYELQCKIFGENHPCALKTGFDIAVIIYTLGNTKRALELFDIFLESDWDIPEPIIRTIAEIYEKEGFPEKAAAALARLQ